MNNLLRAVLYSRVSTDDQAEHGTSLEEQESVNTRIAERLNASIVGIFSDPGVSGTVYPRPGLEESLTLLESGKADILIVYNASRLARRTIVALLVWERIQAAGGRLYLSDSGEVTQENEMMFSMLSGYAQHEWREIVKRMKTGRRRRAEQGQQPHRDRPPFGYGIVRKGEGGPEGEEPGQYYIIPERAETVREIFARYGSGDSLRSICRWLTDAGIPTPQSKHTKGNRFWQPSCVAIILRNTAYIGYALWGKSESRTVNGKTKIFKTPEDRWVRIPCPAIVEEDLWRRCQEVLAKNLQNGLRRDRAHLFSGLMRCPRCGRSMPSDRRTNGRKQAKRYIYIYYKCPDFCKTATASRRVCYSKQHNEETVRAAMREVLRVIAEYPEFFEAAFAAHLRHKQQ